MSISQNFPEESPTLNLNFASSRTLDSRITFNRTSSGTYMGSDGLIKVAAPNQPRFDHRFNSSTREIESLGLLVEETRNNFALNSNDFIQQTSTINASVVNNAIISPDGTQTASRITSDSSTNQHGSTKSTTGLPANSVCSLSVFVKSGTSNFCRVDSANVTNWSTNAGVAVDLSNGNIISGSGTVVPFPNGWYKITIFPTTNSSSGVTRGIWVWVSNSSGNSTTTGTGTESIHVWGSQIEVGSFPTSYIPTTTSSVSRTQDSVSIIGTNFSSFYNPIESSMLWSGRFNGTLSSGVFGAMYSIDTSPPTGNTLRGYYNPFNSFGSYVQSSSSAGQADRVTVLGRLEKMATRYKQNDFAASINGSNVIGFGGNYYPTSLGMLNIGNNFSTVRGVQTISQLSYYPVALPSNQLQTLTR